jgi:2'-hydroxyisoflavone reductase
MNILVMGGTQFLGRAIVTAALDNGHSVSLFHRGKTNPDLFPEAEHLIGDRRETDLTALQGREFDTIIDVSAYIPRAVRELLETVKTNHYTLVSTISVYKRNDLIGQNESAELIHLSDPTVEEITGETYGGLKVLCEETAEQILPDSVLHVRSGLIIGAHDPTDRFSYWPIRVANGGEVLAPIDRHQPMQLIDARDEAEWIIRSVEAGLTGVFNVAGSISGTLGHALELSKLASNSDATITYVPYDFLQTHEVQPWQDLPLWVPPVGDQLGFHYFSVEKALQHGLTFRPLQDSIEQILAWWKTQDRALRIGISAEKEQAVLAAWHAHQVSETPA